MQKIEYRYISCPIKSEIYSKLKYCADVMGVTLNELMKEILENDAFDKCVDTMFKYMSEVK